MRCPALVLLTFAGPVALLACSRPPQPAMPDAPPPTTAPVLLVANKGDANVSVLELPGGRVLATLPTGVGPHEIAVSPDGRRAVVSDYGDQTTVGKTLTVIDVLGLAVVKTIDLGEFRRPHGIAFMPDGKRVVVTAEHKSSVLVVDIDAGVVERSVGTGQKLSHMVALAPDGNRHGSRTFCRARSRRSTSLPGPPGSRWRRCRRAKELG